MRDLNVAVRAKDFATKVFKTIGRGMATFARNALSISKRITTGFHKVFKTLTSIKSILTGFILFQAGSGLFNFVTSVADTGDQLAKLEDRLGLTSDFLSEMGFVADRSGVDFNTLTMSFQRFIRRAEEFRRSGGGEGAAGLKILGGEIADLIDEGAKLDFFIDDLADAFKNLETDQMRVLAAMKLFDSEGVKLVQFLKLGGDEINRLRREAQGLGIVFSKDDIKVAAEFQDALTNFKSVFQGIKKEVVLANLPLVTDFLKFLTEWFGDEQNRQKVITFFLDAGSAVLDFTSKGIQALEQFLNVAISVFNGLRDLGSIDLPFGKKITLFGDFDPGRLEKFDFNKIINDLDDASSFLQRQKKKILQGGFVVRGSGFGEKVDPENKVRQKDPKNNFLDGLIQGLDEAANKASEFGLVAQQIVNSGLGSFTSNLSSSLFDFAEGTLTAEQAWEQFSRNFIRQTGEMITQAFLLKAAQNALGVFGFGGEAPTQTQAKGGISIGPLESVQSFAKGGVLTSFTKFRGPFGNVVARERMQNEAFVPLEGNRSIPVTMKGNVGSQTVVQEFNSFDVNILANDTRGFDELLVKRKDTIVNLVLKKKRQSLETSRGFR